jgi:hypothetical protein
MRNWMVRVTTNVAATMFKITAVLSGYRTEETPER